MRKMFKINSISITLLASAVLVMASCNKDDDHYYLPEAAAVGVVHASAGLPALDVALDNNRLGVNYFNYTDRVDYFRAYTGNRVFKVYHASAPSSSPIFTKNLTFEAGKYYSVFITDTAANMDAVVLRDSTRAAGKDSVRLRFANMSPDAPGLDLYVKGNNTPIATNITYKTASQFFSYPSAGNVIFEVRRNGQTALLATLDPINLYKGRIYTVWTGGYINGNAEDGTRIRLEAFAH
ncbi:DUF4397 domain-containing protein [Niabella digestorum]|jgi:hypothetical protein|uniref:DUF4397 domain-containing protein n=1 Tax=Niabella digestorum TaxID=3117701 RepID=A0ABU7RFW2_9BACT